MQSLGDSIAWQYQLASIHDILHINFFISPTKTSRQCPHRHRHQTPNHQTVHVPCKQLVMSIISQRRDWPRPCKTAAQAALWSASLLPLLCAFPLQSANTSRLPQASQSPTPTAANSCGRDGRARANSAKTSCRQRRDASPSGRRRKAEAPLSSGHDGRAAFRFAYAIACLCSLCSFEMQCVLRSFCFCSAHACW